MISYNENENDNEKNQNNKIAPDVHIDTNIVEPRSVTVRWCLQALTNTQFIKKSV